MIIVDNPIIICGYYGIIIILWVNHDGINHNGIIMINKSFYVVNPVP